MLGIESAGEDDADADDEDKMLMIKTMLSLPL